MTFFSFYKRTILFSILIFTAQVYGQETIIPLTKGGWVGGLSGNVSWDDYNSSSNGYTAKTDGYGFSISSRNGRFVMNNLSVGFDLQWSETSLTTTSSSVSTFDENNRLGFIGLWSRFYIPYIGTGWAVFPEISIGYASYKSINDFHSGAEPAVILFGRDISADGFAYNLGIGATIFVSNNVAFEATARYQGGKLNGSLENYNDFNYEIELSNIDILFGIMIYLK